MESDLLAHGAAEVAHLAGCSVPLAVGHIAMVRAWAVSMADDSAPPDGWVAGDAAGRRIEAAAQWTGERGRLLEALTDAGQVRVEDGGIRVLHLEPYAKAWEQNAKSKERMRSLRERSANTGARTAKFDGQTQTQTQTQKAGAEDLFPAVASAPQVPRASRKSRTSPDKPTDPRHAPLVKALVEEIGFPFDGGKDGAHVKALLALADQQEATRGGSAGLEVLRRARIAWSQFPGFHSARTLSGLRSKWGEFAQADSGRGPAPPSNFDAPSKHVEPAWLDPEFGMG